jgi:hypothetical protein
MRYLSYPFTSIRKLGFSFKTYTFILFFILFLFFYKYNIMRKYIKGDVNLSEHHLTELPDFLSGVEVIGSFACHNNQLTTLKGSPSIVRGAYSCGGNLITNLSGAPDYVKGNFFCGHNELLESLEGGPTTVDDGFYCSYNDNLVSLVGAPSSIKFISCNHNRQLKSLKGSPSRIEGFFFCDNNKTLTSLEGFPEYIGRDLQFRRNGREFTEEEIRAVCEVKGRIYLEPPDKRR